MIDGWDGRSCEFHISLSWNWLLLQLGVNSLLAQLVLSDLHVVEKDLPTMCRSQGQLLQVCVQW